MCNGLVIENGLAALPTAREQTAASDEIPMCALILVFRQSSTSNLLQHQIRPNQSQRHQPRTAGCVHTCNHRKRLRSSQPNTRKYPEYIYIYTRTGTNENDKHRFGERTDMLTCQAYADKTKPVMTRYRCGCGSYQCAYWHRFFANDGPPTYSNIKSGLTNRKSNSPICGRGGIEGTYLQLPKPSSFKPTKHLKMRVNIYSGVYY